MPSQPPRPNFPEITPSQLSVVCDTMLQGLGRQLRSCGVDVKILENSEDHDQAAEVCKEVMKKYRTCSLVC